MRFDKLTTKFQQAFADAQSLANANDNPNIEPVHMVQALLDQDDGSTASLLSYAGVNLAPLKVSLKSSIDKMPKTDGNQGEISISRDLNNLLNLPEKNSQKLGDAYI